jgi:flagellar basal-body rod modification protein FlgD
MAVSGVTSDVNSLLNGTAQKGRQVTADLSGSDVKSTIDSEGDKSLFADGTKQLGKQDFLELLVTQMRYQDPLSPQDNQQFIAQLAQFSSLEGTQNVAKSVDALGTKLDSMVSGQTNSASTISNSTATTMIGKTVRVSASDVLFDPAKDGPISIHVHAEAADSVVSILDSEGNLVNAMTMDEAGERAMTWDGKKADGTVAPAGGYTLKVTSRDGTKETGYTFFEDKVTGVSFSKTGAKLEVNGQSVGFDQVMHVAEASDEENAAQ